jgi:hypothetical protein
VPVLVQVQEELQQQQQQQQQQTRMSQWRCNKTDTWSKHQVQQVVSKKQLIQPASS